MMNFDCNSRRDFLRTALSSLGVAFSIPNFGLRAADQRGAERAKSLLTIWLGGGPSQLETWDPHPGHRIGGEVSSIKTTIPGVMISHLYPQTSEQLHHLSVIRSLVSKEGDHERASYMLYTGYRPESAIVHPSIGSIATHVQESDAVEIPRFISLGRPDYLPRGGFLGDRYDAYRIDDPGHRGRNLSPLVEPKRQDRRLENLQIVSNSFAVGRRSQLEQTLHQHTIDRALTMMTSDQLQAFSIETEPNALKAAYGDNSFGKGCLVARRLLEIGVRSIQVSLQGFDTHAKNHEGQSAQARILDPALATLLNDLVDRDLLQSTMVLVTGEFGRTPKINPLEGRDHWPNGFSCLLGGGGLATGVVIGETDPQGEARRPTNPVEIADLSATILHQLGVNYSQEIVTPIGRPVKFSTGRPIEQLLLT